MITCSFTTIKYISLALNLKAESHQCIAALWQHAFKVSVLRQIEKRPLSQTNLKKDNRQDTISK